MPDEHNTTLWEVYQAVQQLRLDVVQAVADLDKRTCLLEEEKPKTNKRIEKLENKERKHALEHARMVALSTFIAAVVMAIGQIVVAWINQPKP